MIKCTLTGFTTQSLYYPQVTHLTTIAASMHRGINFFVPPFGVIEAFVGRQKLSNKGKQTNKQTTTQCQLVSVVRNTLLAHGA